MEKINRLKLRRQIQIQLSREVLIQLTNQSHEQLRIQFGTQTIEKTENQLLIIATERERKVFLIQIVVLYRY